MKLFEWAWLVFVLGACSWLLFLGIGGMFLVPLDRHVVPGAIFLAGTGLTGVIVTTLLMISRIRP